MMNKNFKGYLWFLILSFLLGAYVCLLGFVLCLDYGVKAYTPITDTVGSYSYELNLDNSANFVDYSANNFMFTNESSSSNGSIIGGSSCGYFVRQYSPDTYSFNYGASYGSCTSTQLTNNKLVLTSFSFEELGTYRYRIDMSSSDSYDSEGYFYYQDTLTMYIGYSNRSSTTITTYSTITLTDSNAFPYTNTININSTSLLNRVWYVLVRVSDLNTSRNSGGSGMPGSISINVYNSSYSSFSSIPNSTINGRFIYYYYVGTSSSTSSTTIGLQLIRYEQNNILKVVSGVTCPTRYTTNGSLVECYGMYYSNDNTSNYYLYSSISGATGGFTGEPNGAYNIEYYPVQYYYNYATNTINHITTTNSYFANSIITTYSTQADKIAIKYLGYGADITSNIINCNGQCSGAYVTSSFNSQMYNYIPYSSFATTYNNSPTPLGLLVTTSTANYRHTVSFNNYFYNVYFAGGGSIDYENGNGKYEKYKKCSAWYDIPCQLSNGLTYVVYNAPIISPIFEFSTGVIETSNSFFDIFDYFSQWNWLFAIISVPLVWLIFKRLLGGE